jgi:hypothetical protein
MTDDARDALLGALVIWTRNDHTHGQDVVDAACEALVEGLDSPALRDLAGLYRDAPSAVVRLTVDEVVAELGLELPIGEEALSRHLLRRQAAALLAGRLTPRAFATWALQSLGYDVSGVRQELVLAADEYESHTWHHVGDVPNAPLDVLDADVRRIAHALLTEPS